jgi:RHS repeat-associated protein
MRRPLLALLLGIAVPAAAQVITSADLQISGANFKIVNGTVTVQQGTPAIVQTSIGDLQNDQAPVFSDGTFATGDLIGPGIATPVPFITAPGRAFTISGLAQEGTYYLQNVRMMKGSTVLQMATPSLAIIQVTNALNATVTVKQLSADDLRKRGISLNPANYDVYGRLTTESDEFGTSGVTGKGNTIRYLYDLTGRLKQIVDPVGRATLLTYWDDATGWVAGRLKEVEDWRHRKIDYGYDPGGRLTTVTLPDFERPVSVRPVIQYNYFPAANGYTDFVDLGHLLQNIIDPEGGTQARATYGYAGARAKVATETWGTGETVKFDFSSPTSPFVVDALAQRRDYTLTGAPKDYFADRVHVHDVTEKDVLVAAINGTPVGVAKLPSLLGAVTAAPQDRKTTFDHPGGLLQTTTLEGVSQTQIGYDTTDPTRPARFDNSTITPLALPSGIGMPQSASLPLSLTTTPLPQDRAFIKSFTINGKTIERPQAFRGLLTPQHDNDSVHANETYLATGQINVIENPPGGTDVDAKGAKTTIDYYDETDGQDFRRSVPRRVTTGSVATEINPTDKDTVKVTDARKVSSTTVSDAYGRPVHVTVQGPDTDNADETFVYYRDGRLRETTRKQGDKTIDTKYFYDVMGRTTLVTTDNVSAGTNGLTTASSKTDYDLLNHTITVTQLPGGAVTTRYIDNLGRTKTATTTGPRITSPIDMTYAYDLAGNLVFQKDNFVATAWAYDSSGRRMAELRQDGTQTIFDHDGWGRMTEVTEKDSASAQVSKVTDTVLGAGTVASRTVDVGSSGTIATNFGWDGAGRATGATVLGGMKQRAAHSIFDDSGRLTLSEAGGGELNKVSDAFAHYEVKSYAGALPFTGISKERGISSAAFNHSFEYNAAGAVVHQQTGSLEWRQHFDEAGNLTSSQPPARPETTYHHDARGLPVDQQLPDGAMHKYDYNAAGTLETYHDPVSEDTSNQTDALGRPTTRLYKDGSSEIFNWEGPRLHDYTDRQGRKQTFGYDDAGRLSDVFDVNNNKIDHIEYDEASRIKAWTTKDARIEYADYDGAGRPNTTRQIRYKNSSGFTTQTKLDQYEQTHHWNALGERKFWTMPSVPSSGPWTASVTPVYDAAGNLETINRTLTGATAPPTLMMSANFRGAGRPTFRNVTTSGGALIERTYSYDDNSTSATGQITEMRVKAGGMTVAGSGVGYDGLQVNDIKLLGVSDETRHSHFEYDTRGRLKGSIYGTSVPNATPSAGVPGAVQEGLSAADFRTTETRTPKLDAATRAILAAKGVDLSTLDPTGVSTGEQAGHKIATVTPSGKPQRSVTYENDNKGATVHDDGQFIYKWDEKGRLTSAMPKPRSVGTLRRVLYFYDGSNRLVGRRAESAQLNSLADSPDTLPWQLDTQANDGLPAETTFVWDPIADVIIEVFDANSGTLLKQIIHGGMGYDDPIEVTTASRRFYPLFDEAGDGNLQAVLDESGHLIARTTPADPYGADALDIAGAAVDKVEVHASKDSGGILQSVEVTVHTTEAMAAATVADGLRLVPAAPTPAQLVDAYTARFTLTGAQWTTLTTTPGTQTLSVAVTPTLRAAAWSSSLPFLPPPDWAQKSTAVYTSAAFPVEVRDSFTALSTFVSGIPSGGDGTRVLYKVDNLSMLGGPTGTDDPIAALVGARFGALPFTDPATGLIYARARWLDPTTGTFLSPDPLGYADSSNLYSYAGGDPVNGRDPTGELDAGSAATQLRLVEELMAEAGPYGIPISLSAMSAGAARGVLGAGTKVLVPVGVGLAGGMLANWSINRAADLSELHADEYVAQRRLEETQAIAAQRKRHKAAAPQVPMLPGVTPYSQQAQVLPDGMIPAQLAQYHNQEVGSQQSAATSGIVVTPRRGSQPLRLKFGPVNPGPLPVDIASTFRSSTYEAVVLSEPTVLYRSYSDPKRKLRPFWTRTKPAGPLQAVIDGALDQNWGNRATDVVAIRVPAGRLVYEGAAAGQRGLVGGGNQVYIDYVDPSWEIKKP